MMLIFLNTSLGTICKWMWRSMNSIISNLKSFVVMKIKYISLISFNWMKTFSWTKWNGRATLRWLFNKLKVRDLMDTQTTPKSTSEHSSGKQHSSSSAKESHKESKPVVVEKPPVEEDKGLLINKKELFEKVSTWEYEEARYLDSAEAVEMYRSTLAQFEENVAELFAMKHSPEGIDEGRKMALRLEGLSCLTTLRTMKRLLKFKLKIVKDEQLVKRQAVDAEHLTLQNLLYEATNLQNQVAATQDYKGMDEKIDLIPVEQFYKDAPEKVSKPELTKNDPHLLRIGRLEYEFIQRQKLMEECSALEKEKETIAKVLEATLPLQDFFGLDISAKKARNETAKFLPPALYVLFVQSEAFQEATESKQLFSVRIGGDADAARELVIPQDEADDDSDSERAERNNEDHDMSDRRMLRKRSSAGMSLDDNRKKIFQKHPLWIEWIVRSKFGESVTVQFFYLLKLKIVTVKSRVHRETSDGTTSTSISGNSDNMLNELFPNDCGLESPNPANYFIFNKFAIPTLAGYLKEIGRPYTWAQTVCGLEFPELGTRDRDFEARATHSVSCKSIEGTLKLIRKRLTNQAKLWNQLKALETRNIQIPPGAKELLPQKNATVFQSWEAIDYETYAKYGFTELFITCGTVSEKDMFFKATLQRGRAKIMALVAIKMDFPAVAPIFCVQFDLDGENLNATTHSDIREIEKEINVFTPVQFDEWADVLVSIQLHRLMTCCDIILETDFVLRESEGPSEFSKEKLLLKATAGRNLRRPFEFSPSGNYFTQRY